jgi:diacylglycerol kinase
MIPWLGRLARSFGCAFAGLVCLMRTQRNARIHLLAGGAVISAGAWLGISAVEWCIVTLACGIVIAAEALNTAVESLADRVTTEKDERIRMAKDVAAAGVLVTAIAALIVGLIIFLPRAVAKL